MEKVYQVFSSFEASERADREYYRSLTGVERINILLELVSQWNGDEAAKGFERVYRVAHLKEG